MAFDIKNLDVDEGTYLTGLSNLNNMENTSEMSLSGLAGAFSSGLGAFQGLSMMSDSIDMIKSGANYTASVYRNAGAASLEGSKFSASVLRQSGQAAVMVANYNIALDQQATARQEDALGRQVADTLSTNASIMGASGIGLGSRSYTMVTNDILDTSARSVVNLRNDAKQRQTMTNFQGQMTQTQYENEARAAEYSGEVQNMQYENQARSAEYEGKIAEYKAKVQQADAIGGAVKGIFSAFGGF